MLERLKRILTGWRDRVLDALRPGAVASGGIAAALKVAALLIGGFAGLALHLGYGKVVDFVAGVVLAWLLIGLAEWLFRLLRTTINALPTYLTDGGFAALLGGVLLVAIFAFPPPALMLVAGLAAIAVVCIGAGLALLRARDPRRLQATIAVVAGLFLAGTIVYAIVSDGWSDDPVIALVPERAAAPAEFAALLERGPYNVGHLTYGSGDDRRRPEYRTPTVSWTTEPVDASRMLPGLEGWAASARQSLWGFGADAFPLNARVWYPQDRDVPAPLVMVVHGNHNMLHYSDGGYAWLGEHLASRGYIVVSVDQNFVNSGPFVGGMRPENDARGWLLLEHLARWRDWTGDAGHLFHGRVDLERVVLIGHSRGGEAAAIAAAFNRLDHYPDDARMAFNYGFGIRGVIAVAPSDGQYQPSHKPVWLEDVSYLTVQGGLDADVSQFQGDRQFQRIRFTAGGDHYRAAIYLHHANHGQFNTVWGRHDVSGPRTALLETRHIMSGEDQRRAGLLLFTAFIDERLADRRELRPLFMDPEVAGDLLPATPVVSRFGDARTTVLADFEDGIDLTRDAATGARISASDFARWRESDLRLRGDRPRGDTAQLFAWRREDGTIPTWTLTLPGNTTAGADSVFVIDLTHLDMDLPNGPPRTAALRDPLSFSIALVDADGSVAVQPLEAFGRLYPPLPVTYTKLVPLTRKRYPSPTEPVVSSVFIPVAAFDGIDTARVTELRLIFDGSPEGVLGIARVAVSSRNEAH